MSFRVLHPGTYSLLVDAGRPCWRSLGVPLGGAADRAAFAIGNALVGNAPDAVALEISLSGPTLVAEQDCSASVFGTPFTIQIDQTLVPAGVLVQVRAGQTMKIGGTSRGARAYFCVRGGFESKRILQSGSALIPIAEQDRLICQTSLGSGRSLSRSDAESLFALLARNPHSDATREREKILRVIDGPQADWFSVSSFYEQRFAVSPASNRMGVRLQGQPILCKPRELISEAVAPGAVQITNEGLPIILGVDGQTIGGYPKIAHVIRADVDRIAQFRPGENVAFERVSIKEAEDLSELRQRKLRRWLNALRRAAE